MIEFFQTFDLICEVIVIIIAVIAIIGAIILIT